VGPWPQDPRILLLDEPFRRLSHRRAGATVLQLVIGNPAGRDHRYESMHDMAVALDFAGSRGASAVLTLRQVVGRGTTQARWVAPPADPGYLPYG